MEPFNLRAQIASLRFYTSNPAALSLHFTGSEHITATLPEHQASFGEEIVFRFRTEMSSCTVFASQPGGLLQGSLQDGKFRLAYRFSAASLSQRNGSQVSDDMTLRLFK